MNIKQSVTVGAFHFKASTIAKPYQTKNIVIKHHHEVN